VRERELTSVSPTGRPAAGGAGGGAVTGSARGGWQIDQLVSCCAASRGVEDLGRGDGVSRVDGNRSLPADGGGEGRVV